MGRNFRAHLFAWLALPVFAILNATARELTYGRSLPYAISHSVSVIPLVFVIALWARYLARRRPLPDARSAAIVGIVWLALTVAFETGLGVAGGLPLARIFAEYDVLRGSLWPFVPLVTLLAPMLVHRLRNVAREAHL